MFENPLAALGETEPRAHFACTYEMEGPGYSPTKTRGAHIFTVVPIINHKDMALAIKPDRDRLLPLPGNPAQTLERFHTHRLGGPELGGCTWAVAEVHTMNLNINAVVSKLADSS